MSSVRSFSITDPIPPQVDPNSEMMIDIAATILLHGELDRDSAGRPTSTLRSLIDRFVPKCSGLLHEYIVHFGSYGFDIISNYTQGCGVPQEDFLRRVRERCDNFKAQL